MECSRNIQNNTSTSYLVLVTSLTYSLHLYLSMYIYTLFPTESHEHNCTNGLVIKS